MATIKLKYTEDELVASLKRNEKKAFEYLYDNYSSALYGIIFRVINDEIQTEDVMQEVFLKIWRKINDYDPSRGRLFTWMMNIARNSSIDHLRKDKVTLDDIDESVSKLDKMAHFQPEIATLDLRELMKKLKPERQILLDMVYLQGYTQEEAATKLNIPLGTVKSRIRIALQDLKNYFAI
ncbi:MAG: RNA polymerase sigma factor [Spirosomataceae bacterium]